MDRLHSIENKEDKLRRKQLTSFSRGVEQHRSLTVSEVYPVGAESGARAKSPLMLSRQRAEGEARVYSEALVEANRKQVKSRIGSRRS